LKTHTKDYKKYGEFNIFCIFLEIYSKMLTSRQGQTGHSGNATSVAGAYTSFLKKFWGLLVKNFHKNIVKKHELCTKSVRSKTWFIFGFP
jgi:hypothetical protein